MDIDKPIKAPIKVAITGAAGNIAYSLLFKIATGSLFGNHPIDLRLIEKESNKVKIAGVAMELDDCATPIITNYIVTCDLGKGFDGADIIVLLGAKPRSKGMERKDLLKDNGEIFKLQGAVINEAVARDAKILVVGNPANTNALIAMSHAPNLDPDQFSCLTRLDHNRALAMIAGKSGVPVEKVTKMIVWGNHSSTQFPDTTYCCADGEAMQVDALWTERDFIPAIQQRGAEIIKVRGSSSIASAAHACIKHIQDWVNGTPENDWVSMGILSDGSYGSPPGVIFSYPVTVTPDIQKELHIVQGLPLNDFQKERIRLTGEELLDEKRAVADLIGNHPSL